MERSRYVIGDIHGRYETLMRLVDSLPDPEPEIWLVGDLVNVGPRSAEVVRWARAYPHLRAVLGNHDLHLLAIATGHRPLRKKDTFRDVLDAPDAAELLEWLRTRSLMLADDGLAMVHAGLLPGWSLERALSLAREVEAELHGERWTDIFPTMYGDEPRRWSDTLEGEERRRCIINAMTRARVITSDEQMNFSFKGEVQDIPADHVPWFERAQLPEGITLCFGHWSALDLQVVHRHRRVVPIPATVPAGSIVALDSGCAWGRRLSAFDVRARTLRSIEVIR